MSDKFLNLTAVQALKTWIGGKFATIANLNALSNRVDDIVAEGGEPNVIETVKVNDAALTPDAQKAVNVTVPTKTSDIANDGDGESPFATEDYVAQNGGKIDTISVNGTQQTITNKNVDISVPTTVAQLTDASDYAKAVDVPTKTSDITNDSDFQTEAEVQALINDAVVGALKPKGSCAFADLPPLTVEYLNTLYDITDAFTTTEDFKEGAGYRHSAGTNVAIVNVGTDANPVYKYDVMPGPVDFSAYWTSTTGEINTLEAATVEEINAILEPSA